MYTTRPEIFSGPIKQKEPEEMKKKKKKKKKEIRRSQSINRLNAKKTKWSKFVQI